MPASRTVWTCLALLLLAAGAGHAGSVAVLRVAGPDDLAEGALEGLSLGADGVIRPGPVFQATPLDVPTAWAAVESGPHLWIGTGNEGRILRVAADGSILGIPTGDSLMVTALTALPDGGVAVAVFPGGRILRVNAAGEVTPLATLPAEHVWALLPDRRGGLVAGTGLPGALFSLDAFGAVQRRVDLPDDHARCLARREDATLVGTAPKGLVLSVRGEETAVLRDLDAQEVVGLLPGADGGLLVAANADPAGGNAQLLRSLLDQMLQPPETRPGQDPPPRGALQDGEILWIEPSGAVTSLWARSKTAVLTLVADGEGAAAGTYPGGRVIRVEPGRAHALFADLPQAEASVLLGGPEGLDLVVTSNPAVLHRRVPETPGGTWTSAPLDAEATARWGRADLVGDGLAALEFRSGETESPDEAWSEWRAAGGFDGEGGETGATARFLQVRVTLRGPEARFRGLEVVVAAPNRAPRIASLAVKRPGSNDGAGIPTATPLRVVEWKVEDPDGDRLLVSLHARREGAARWLALVEEEILDKPQWSWDTSGVPDGEYVLRLRVSDAPDTPPDAARVAEEITAPLRVDNTPPRVEAAAQVAGERLLVRGRATDQPGGRIARVRVALNGAPWRVLAADDGLLDEWEERFEVSLPSPGPGEHDVVVQAADADGNLGATATAVSIR